MERTLLLNSTFEPLKIISWQRAITLLTQGKVEVIDFHDREVRGVTISFRLPSILRLLKLVKVRRASREVRFSRANIYQRDKNTSQYCGTRQPAEASPLTQQQIAAAASGNQPEVERLLIKGAEINGPDSTGRTPVIAAASANHVEVVRYLVQYGADVNLKDKSGRSAFLISTSEVGPEDALLVVMLNGGARVDTTDAAGDTGLIRASRHGYVNVMRRLLTNNATVNQVNAAGRTALNELLLDGTCTTEYVNGVDLLVRSGADVRVEHDKQRVK